MEKQAEEILNAAVKKITEAALELIYKDSHYWSERPCPTCQSVTSLTGVDFGCIRYRKEKRG